jgi:predicted nuclease with TOPRIM domain
LKKEKQAETNQFQQQIKKLEEEKSQLSSQLQKVYQVLGVPNPSNQLVSEPKSSQKSQQDTAPEKVRSKSSSLNAETTATTTSKSKTKCGGFNNSSKLKEKSVSWVNYYYFFDKIIQLHTAR